MSEIRAVTIDAWPLAARIAGGLSSNGWCVVVVEPGSESVVADALGDELRSLVDNTVRCLPIYHVDELLEANKADLHDVLVGALQTRWMDEDWRKIDMQRSRLMRAGMAILVVSIANAETMVGSAPNLWSWIGGEVWTMRLEKDQ